MNKRLLLVVGLAVLLGVGIWLLRTPPPDPEPGPAPGVVDGGDDALRVTVVAPEGATGRVGFALFDGAASFGGEGPPRQKRFLDLDAAGRATWRVEGLAPGRYAVKAYHDANANGELDKGAFGAPSEPYGFSRNARGRFGPPAWDDASFALGSAGLALEITLQ
jgi:uncharacterized protein (DUF2141 family)